MVSFDLDGYIKLLTGSGILIVGWAVFWAYTYNKKYNQILKNQEEEKLRQIKLMYHSKISLTPEENKTLGNSFHIEDRKI